MIFLQDEDMFKMLRNTELNIHVDPDIFVINTTDNDLMLEKYSEEINRLLKPSLPVNTVFHRLFTIKSSDISFRLSLYFEESLLDDLSKYKWLHKSYKTILPHYKNAFGAVLRNGPLDIDTCKQFLRLKAEIFRLPGEKILRMPSEIQMFNIRVIESLCKSLGQEIFRILKKELNAHIHEEHNRGILDITTGYRSDLMQKNIEQVIEQNVGRFDAPVVFGAAFDFSVNTDEEQFRHDIADKVLDRIILSREHIIQTVLLKFHDISLKDMEHAEMCDILNSFKTRNTNEIYFNKCKTIAERFDLFSILLRIAR